MKLKKENKGITLVALVITIVILLILAGISIAQLKGNGLFENAKIAKEKTLEEQKKEDKTLSDYESKIGQYIDGTRNENENSYSTEEKVIGTWIDGKKLYQKTIYFDTNISMGNETTLTNDFSYIETMVDMEGFGVNKSHSYCGIGAVRWLFTTEKKIRVFNVTLGENVTNVYLTLRYTKVE